MSLYTRLNVILVTDTGTLASYNVHAELIVSLICHTSYNLEQCRSQPRLDWRTGVRALTLTTFNLVPLPSLQYMKALEVL